MVYRFCIFSFFLFFFVTIGKLIGSRDSSVVMGFTPKSRFCFWGLEVSFGIRLSLLVLTRFAVSCQVARSVLRPIF